MKRRVFLTQILTQNMGQLFDILIESLVYYFFFHKIINPRYF